MANDCLENIAACKVRDSLDVYYMFRYLLLSETFVAYFNIEIE